MIGLAVSQIHPESKARLSIRATITYDGSAGNPVYLRASAGAARQRVAGISAPALPIRVRPVGQDVTLMLALDAPDPEAPLAPGTDTVVLQLAAADGVPCAEIRVPYVRQWYRDLPAFRPADLAAAAFGPDPLSTGALRAAYDGDEDAGIVLARPRAGGLVGLAVQAGAALTVVRWVDYAVPAGPAGARPVRPGYTVPPGGFVDLAGGQSVADPAAADAVWEPAAGADPPMRLRPLNGATLATLQTPLLLPVAATRVFGQANSLEGTQRHWDEIADLFDNGDTVAYRAGRSVDRLWTQAGIDCRITVRRDIRVPDNWAHELPATGLREFSRLHNLPGALNVYFFHSVEGARAWGASDRNPGAPGQQGALWVGDRCADLPDAVCWAADVVTVAHEIGHFLNLIHCCDDAAPRPPCAPGDEQYLMYGDGTTAESHLLAPEEIFRTRQRAWAYRP